MEKKKLDSIKERIKQKKSAVKQKPENKPSQSKPSFVLPRHESRSFDDSIRPLPLKGVFEQYSRFGKKLYTVNMVPGKRVYDELLVNSGGVEYREWNPGKSKLGAAIVKGISQTGIMPGKTVLYLGCSTGTTSSHVSDILGEDGFIFGIDFSPRVMREFVFLCEDRKNMAPLMADCNHPELYEKYVPKVDVVFQDIAQRNQLDIFIKNCDMFLKKGGFGILAVKARSIDVTENPRVIFAQIKKDLNDKIPIVDYRELEPFERDHCIFVVKKQ